MSNTPWMPGGPMLAELLCSMDLEPLELVPSPPRTYPTNYLDGPPWEQGPRAWNKARPMHEWPPGRYGDISVLAPASLGRDK